uniref:Uncharacterized protein n=1 Tax=Siphoviridae sp. ctHip2 TaxID=2827830 RepID=A0A8S5RWR8_9CAUD|nr:MAG TPA: hypothetical protein [Siphoviridae sp. ctHip2]
MFFIDYHFIANIYYIYLYFSKKSKKTFDISFIKIKKQECTILIIKKGHGYFRKSKAYGLSSCIVLGTTLLLGTGVVSAQETTAKTEVKTEQVTKQRQILKQQKMIQMLNC